MHEAHVTEEVVIFHRLEIEDHESWCFIHDSRSQVMEAVIGAFERNPRLRKQEMPAGNGQDAISTGVDIADPLIFA